ncbi:uncharacterized protein LOC126844103 isoform X1 [Adelges cooleyi]|uniref:uncharacterized protein LOC126844103 isoform X1 n=1 Tax=Adelges cooleyi TaxID=133065 RepID=UPI00217F7059|nr:uncharacterized protein LOC126844103 isoform X1 [Adelges cooleyi]XP_050437928.1 uncharacterized protein LOC126844103 isoform X1 [Adelges cooleyi]
MKPICFFILFVNILNVSAHYLAEYKKQLLITNVSIMEAGTDILQRIIEEMFNEVNHCDIFGKLNFMIAVPDKLDFSICIPDSDLRPIPIMDKLLDYQDFMGWKIRRTLRMKYPNIDNNQDFKSLDLTALAQDRRDHTGPALKNIIIRILDEPVQGIPDDIALKRVCNLIGLHMSAQFPASYITKIQIDLTNRTCTLSNGYTDKIYRKNGVWGQISENGTVLQRLKDQLV